MKIHADSFYPAGRHCEARSAVAIQENLYGLLRCCASRNDGPQGKGRKVSF